MTALRHFPPPWSVEEVGADVQRRAFIVKDSAGQELAYVYFEEGRRSAAKLLTKDEAGRMRRTSQSCRSWCGRPRWWPTWRSCWSWCAKLPLYLRKASGC